MELVIAVVLIVILLCRILSEKSNLSDYNRKEANWENSTKAFSEHYTNEQLEASIRQMFSDDSQLQAVRSEVDMALRQMGSWAGTKLILCTSDFVYPNGKFTQKAYRENTEQMQRDRRLATEILLVNRGKVSSDATTWGYAAYLNTDYKPLKEKQYELVDWIQKTLAKQGVELTPVCIKKSGIAYYAWLGSSAAPDPPFVAGQERLAFGRHLIETPASSIPAPYYKQ